MSSCFLCDTSYNLTYDDEHVVSYAPGKNQYYMIKYMPIIVGSSGTNRDDQQHEDNGKQNYVSYRVKKIEFRSNVYESGHVDTGIIERLPCYILIFKVPFRNPVFDYNFRDMKKFILFSEPESVLKYGIYSWRHFEHNYHEVIVNRPEKFDLIIDKPFILGPNDYVGVLYMFIEECKISSSAKVWFDVV